MRCQGYFLKIVLGMRFPVPKHLRRTFQSLVKAFQIKLLVFPLLALFI